MAGRSGATAALPLAAFCCLGLLLLGIAATIVLALIPIYTRNKDVTPSSDCRRVEIFSISYIDSLLFFSAFSTSRSYSVPISSSASGASDLTATERAQLANRVTLFSYSYISNESLFCSFKIVTSRNKFVRYKQLQSRGI